MILSQQWCCDDVFCFFFSSRRRHTRCSRDWSSDVCSSDLLTLGLVLGSVWGKLAWGDYWGWDPKELWSLASWLVYVGYFHFRYMFGKTRPRINSIWAIAGMAVIVITLLWVNLSHLFIGLHTYAT